MAQLKTQISAMSKAHDGFTDLEGLAQSISSSLWSLNPVSCLHWITIVAVAIGITILLLLILPLIFRLIFSSISTAKRDIYALPLLSKKGRDAAVAQ